MRKLTKSEIEQLYQFTRKHYVEYYDIQTELVDHLATGMEKNWEDEPNLDFKENLNKEFKKFGVFGFSDIVSEKTKQMEKRYWKLLGIRLKDFVLQPKILFPFMAGIGLVAFLLYRFEYAIACIFGLIILQIIYLFRRSRDVRNRLKNQQKVYLLESFIVKGGALSAAFLIPSLLSNFTNSIGSISSLGTSFIVSFMVCFVLVFNWVALKVLPEEKEDILSAMHPERKWLDI